jgi:beta-lactamase regulating signal transducer with metallopeptidase domain
METLFSWLTAVTWKGSLLIGAMLLLHTFLRRWIPAGWRHALLLVALVRLALPIAPESPLSIFNLTVSPQRAPFIQIVPVASGSTEPIVIPRRVPPTPDRTASPTTVALITIWAAGALLVAGTVVRRSMRMSRRLSDVSDIHRPDLIALLDSARTAIGVRRKVKLATTSEIDTPSLHGWFRPVLLLPSQVVESFSPEQLRFIFLHEMAHLRRADVPVNWFIAAVHAINWFNPLVWLAVTRLEEDRELACDELALSKVGHQERTAYGRTVLQLLDQLRTPSLVPGLVGMSSTHDQIKRRILMIATFRNTSRFSLLFGAATLAVALVTLTDASAGERRVFRHHIGPVSPEAKASMERLDVPMNLDLSLASVDEVLNAISARTGVAIDTTAIDADTRAKRMTLKATDLPAHLLLIETLSAVGLTAEFTADGAVVKKGDDDHHEFTHVIPAHGAGSHEGDRHVIFINKNGDVDVDVDTVTPVIDPDDVVVEKDRVVIKRFDLRKTEGDSAPGVTRRKLKIHGGDGQPAGTLEIEVQKTP